MSYSIQEARAERAQQLQAAVSSGEPEQLRTLARIIMKEGNEHLAHDLYMKANRIEMAFDEARDEALIDELAWSYKFN